MRPERTFVNPSSLLIIGVPKRFTETTLNDFETHGNHFLHKVRGYVGEYISDLHGRFKNGEGIVFMGENGVGKTMLSCIILREAYRLRYTCRRVTFSEYINNYTRGWGGSKFDRDENEDDLNSNYKGVEFLVLEEVGKEIDSKIALPILEDLLRYREEKGYVTIMCTNMDKQAFVEKYGKSCMSLLRGTMTPVVIDSVDRRRDYFEKRRESE